MFVYSLDGLHNFTLVVFACRVSQHSFILVTALFGNFSFDSSANIFKKFLFISLSQRFQSLATDPERFFFRAEVLQGFLRTKRQQLFPNAAHKRRIY